MPALARAKARVTRARARGSPRASLGRTGFLGSRSSRFAQIFRNLIVCSTCLDTGLALHFEDSYSAPRSKGYSGGVANDIFCSLRNSHIMHHHGTCYMNYKDGRAEVFSFDTQDFRIRPKWRSSLVQARARADLMRSPTTIGAIRT